MLHLAKLDMTETGSIPRNVPRPVLNDLDTDPDAM